MARWSSEKYWRYCTPTPKLILFGVGLLLLAGLTEAMEMLVMFTIRLLHMPGEVDFSYAATLLCFFSALSFTFAIAEKTVRSDERIILYDVRKALCLVSFGNPLHLRDGEIEPYIVVSRTLRGYRITISCPSVDFEDVANLEMTISGSLQGKFGDYAVVSKEEDIAGRYVDYYVEDVVFDYHKQSVYCSIEDVPADMTKVYIRSDVCIDYGKVLNASAIVAGRSRSGKTTAIISTFLLPFLKLGRDKFGSKILIVDPKSAELSLCPHVLSPDENGGVEHILEAVRSFNSVRVERQRAINEACRESGVPKKWFELGMHPSVLFLDEFVSVQDMFPKKAPKENPDYCLSTFQGLLRQIATQGASAGCFLILSTAEASVGTGGLESAVNNACGIRILFKPSKDEARFLWSSEKLEVLRERRYDAGDAWFCADDGINNCVKFVKFPRLEFGEYAALAKLLKAYYDDPDAHSATCEANERCAVPAADEKKPVNKGWGACYPRPATKELCQLSNANAKK